MEIETSKVGPYVLGPAIGRGASATLYRAYQPLIDRWVALKLAHQEAVTFEKGGTSATSEVVTFEKGETSSTWKDLLHEARLLARLHHPGVVTLYDAGWDRGLPYLALELLAGPSLAHPGQRPWSLADVLNVGRRLAGTLTYLHQRQIVHADLKPSNILLRGPGEPVLVDFGLARYQAQGAGLPAGTPAYMAPEQAEGQALPSSDVYALGLILYGLLTGELPLPPGSPLEMVHGHRRWLAREIESLRPDVPSRLSLAIHRCLAKEASDRFNTASELEGELALAALELEPSRRAMPPPAKQTRTRPFPSLLLAALLAALAAAPFWSLWRVLLDGGG